MNFEILFTFFTSPKQESTLSLIVYFTHLPGRLNRSRGLFIISRLDSGFHLLLIFLRSFALINVVRLICAIALLRVNWKITKKLFRSYFLIIFCTSTNFCNRYRWGYFGNMKVRWIGATNFYFSILRSKTFGTTIYI